MSTLPTPHNPIECDREPCSECFDPSDYERPVPPPVVELGTGARLQMLEPEPLIHLAQVAVFLGPGYRIESWCSAAGAVVFDPCVSNCEACKRAHREAVST